MRAEQRPPHAAAQQLAHARPTTPRHPPTNPLAAPSSGAHVPLTVGTRAVVLVASCGTRTRSAARAIEQRVRSAWRASAMRAQQHQPCGALSWSRRRTHGCRKQLRVSGRREQLRRSQLDAAMGQSGQTRWGNPGAAIVLRPPPFGRRCSPVAAPSGGLALGARGTAGAGMEHASAISGARGASTHGHTPQGSTATPQNAKTPVAARRQRAPASTRAAAGPARPTACSSGLSLVQGDL